MMTKSKWFFRHSDTGTKGKYQELFAGNEYHQDLIVRIKNKCTIQYVMAISSLNMYLKEQKTNYYYQSWYDHKQKKIYSSDPLETILNNEND